MEVYLRYCPDCGEEYQPHMTRCIECGAALRDLLEGEVPDVAAQRPVEPSLPPGDYRELIDGLAGSTAHRLVQLCASAGIPVKVASARSGLGLSARAEERPAVLAILEAAVQRLFADPAIAYLHVHNAKPGCYNCSVVRA